MKNFITHIEALRGLAILMVILFHLIPDICPNGYYGVDIFLMISGYFLVSNIVDEERGGGFSLKEFAYKKIMRIFPPLLVLILIMLPTGLLIFPYEELLVSAKTALASLYGGSNIFLDKEYHGYFAGDSGSNLFLHTWYLSVIVQLYLIFALLAFFLRRCATKIVWSGIMLLGAISGGIVVYYRIILPLFQPMERLVPMYYWTWSRTFEVVAGASILLLPTIKHKLLTVLVQTLALIGIFLICFSSDKNLELILFCGVCLIWCYPKGRFGLLLNNPIFRFFGKYSFSLYLWHWPFIAIRNYVAESIDAWDNILLFLLCIASGIVAYYLVEKRRWKLWVLVILYCMAIIVCLAIPQNSENIKALNPEVYEVVDDKVEFITKVKVDTFPSHVLTPWQEGTCGDDSYNGDIISKLGSATAPPTFVMVGDSHANAFVPGMAIIAKRLNICGYYLPTYITPFYNRMCSRKHFRFTGDQAAALIDWLKSQPNIKYVVLAQRWSIRLTDYLSDEAMPLHYSENMVDTSNLYEETERALVEFCRRIKSIDKTVIIITEVPFIKASPPTYLRRALMHNHSINRTLLRCSNEQYYTKCKRHLKTFYNMEKNELCKVFPIHLSLIKNGYFDAFESKRVRMADTNHISITGAKLYAEEHFEDWRPYLSHESAEK